MRRMTIGVLALALSVAACASSDATSPTVSVAGTYTLKAINGSPLPYAVLSARETRPRWYITRPAMVFL